MTHLRNTALQQGSRISVVQQIHRRDRQKKIVSIVSLFLLWAFQTSIAAEFRFHPSGKGIKEALQNGEIKEALAYYEATAAAAERTAAGTDDSKTLRRAGWFYSAASHAARYSGDFQKALAHGHRALRIARRLEATGRELLALSKIASVYGLMRDTDALQTTIDLAEAALERMPKTRNRRLFYIALFGYYQGSYYYFRREFDEALDSYSAALSDTREFLSKLRGKPKSNWSVHAAREQVVRLYIRMGDAHLRKGEPQVALTQYSRASNLLKRWNLRSHVDRHLHTSLGGTHRRLGNWDKALKHYTKALELLSIRDRPERAANIHATIAELHESRGEYDAALRYYRASIRVVESTRALLELRHRHSYFRMKLEPYLGMTRALLAAGDKEQAFDYVERARSRDFLDLLGNRVRPVRSGADSELTAAGAQLTGRLEELHARLSARGNRVALRPEIEEAESVYEAFTTKAQARDEELASITMVDPLKLNEVQALLPPNTSLIEYFVGDKRTFIWVVTKNRVHFHEAKMGEQKLRNVVRNLREKIARRDSVHAIAGLSRELYETLFHPIRGHLTSEDVVIVPHDSLHYLPFQALLGPDGRYMVEDFAIRYLPSASVLKFTTRKKKPSARRILAVGNPRLDGRGEGLEFAHAEAEAIGRLFDDTTVLLEDRATETAIKEIAPRFDILHFATHAELNQEDILSTALLLASGDENDGRLEVKEIFEMNLSADLVVLSACETGLGKRFRGDELIGLTRAFIYAGTPSVIASLWKVEDSATARLMSSFYEHLRQSPKVDALRKAQIQLIRGGGQVNLVAARGVGGIAGPNEDPPVEPAPLPTSHPYFWAPFVLVGEG